MKANFQLIFLIIFIAAAVIAIFVFAGIINIGSDGENTITGSVVMWGTAPSTAFTTILEDFNNANKTFTVSYVQKNPETFDQDLLEALAEGRGPDLFLLPDDLAYKYQNKIFAIPYSSYPLATFKNNFAAAGEVFLISKGILALPISVDPLMLFYNRATLDANGVVYPPATWDDLFNIAPVLTKKDEANKITKSAVALGHVGNVAHAKDIIASLFMQTGNPILKEENGVFASVLDSVSQNPGAILKFYTDFADPNNPVYSWNRSFANSSQMFSREDLALYFGYASELQSLVNRNPNHNFFIAPIPQFKDSNRKATKAKVTGIAISQASKNLNAAYTAASLMATSDFASKFAQATTVAPARRDLLAVKGSDMFSPIIYGSALFARSWLDPSPKDTNNIFMAMINSVLSNNLSPDDAVRDASTKLQLLLNK